jgi:hypothetical protein
MKLPNGKREECAKQQKRRLTYTSVEPIRSGADTLRRGSQPLPTVCTRIADVQEISNSSTSGQDIVRSSRPGADRTLRATGSPAQLSNGVAVVISSNWGGFAGWVGRG